MLFTQKLHAPPDILLPPACHPPRNLTTDDLEIRNRPYLVQHAFGSLELELLGDLAAEDDRYGRARGWWRHARYAYQSRELPDEVERLTGKLDSAVEPQ